jgi:hypothetical protein
MGRRTASKKQDVADQIDKALTNLGVDPDTLATFKRDYLSFARYDLFQTFDAIVSLNVRENKLSPKPMSDLLEQLQGTDLPPWCKPVMQSREVLTQAIAIYACREGGATLLSLVSGCVTKAETIWTLWS